MKIKFYFLALFFLSIYQVSAQNPNPITIGGTCSDAGALGVYNYTDIANGKAYYTLNGVVGQVPACNNYDTSNSCPPAISYYKIEWSGSRWEWYIDVNSLSCQWFADGGVCIPAFDPIPPPSTILLATNTNDTALPPCSGWVAEAAECLPDITTGCESLSVFQNTFSSNITLYPNPTNGDISIDLGNINSSINVRLMSLIGKVIWTKDFNNTSSIQLDINQPTGIYFIELSGEKGEKAFLKLVKE